MEKQRLELDALTVDSFRTGAEPAPTVDDPAAAMIGRGIECTGCVSGCGIINY